MKIKELITSPSQNFDANFIELEENLEEPRDWPISKMIDL